MSTPNKQIGWGPEENLLSFISKQLDYLTTVAYNTGGGGGIGTLQQVTTAGPITNRAITVQGVNISGNLSNGVTNVGGSAGTTNTGSSVVNFGYNAGNNNTFNNAINLGNFAQVNASNQIAFNTGIANTRINLPIYTTELILRDVATIETIAYLSDMPTKTSDLINDGENGIIPFIDKVIDIFGDIIIDDFILPPPTIGTIVQPTITVSTASVNLNSLPSIDWEIIPNPNTVGLTGLTGNTSTTIVDNLEQSTTYTFQVLSNGDLSVPSANVIINAQPIPTEYYVRPSGTTYGTGDGTSFANAWSGFTAINWSILNTKTLNVVGTHNEELNVQQDAVTIVGNNISGAGIIDAQNTRVCFRINGYDNITVNNLSMINGQTSNAFNMLTTGTIYNNCIFDTSGNQTAQHEGNIISDLISVTYNGCTFKNGADDGVSLHGNNTTVVLNNCSMENNSQGVNAINTGICVINDSNFLNNITDIQPDSSSDITVNRSTFRSQLSANSTVPMKLNNCTMLSGETIITSLGSAIISDTKYIGASKITSNQTDITKVIITRCYFEVNAIAKVTTINNGVYDLTYSTFKHFSGTNVYGASTGGTGTSTINNCNFIGVTSTGRGIAAGGRVNVKNSIFQGLNLVVNPNGANAIVTFEKCCTYLNTTINVNQNGGTFTNTSSVTTNPLFTDLPNLDFRLTTGSSCWNTGLTLTNSTGILSANWSTGMPTVTTKTQAATWDIGAYIH